MKIKALRIVLAAVAIITLLSLTIHHGTGSKIHAAEEQPVEVVIKDQEKAQYELFAVLDGEEVTPLAIVKTTDPKTTRILVPGKTSTILVDRIQGGKHKRQLFSIDKGRVIADYDNHLRIMPD